MTGEETVAELRARLNADYEIDQRIWTNNRGSRSAFENHVRQDWPAIDGMLARLAVAEADAEVRNITHPCPICDAAAERRRARGWEQQARSDERNL